MKNRQSSQPFRILVYHFIQQSGSESASQRAFRTFKPPLTFTAHRPPRVKHWGWWACAVLLVVGQAGFQIEVSHERTTSAEPREMWSFRIRGIGTHENGRAPHWGQLTKSRLFNALTGKCDLSLDP
ncbi:hypothetical protein B0H19DRAFT_1059508 [Mycena capillaripes]|nr:hypothetical protein B0H19DRAFT_1059508 [Mycena capillaripes]